MKKLIIILLIVAILVCSVVSTFCYDYDINNDLAPSDKLIDANITMNSRANYDYGNVKLYDSIYTRDGEIIRGMNNTYPDRLDLTNVKSTDNYLCYDDTCTLHVQNGVVPACCDAPEKHGYYSHDTSSGSACNNPRLNNKLCCDNPVHDYCCDNPTGFSYSHYGYGLQRNKFGLVDKEEFYCPDDGLYMDMSNMTNSENAKYDRCNLTKYYPGYTAACRTNTCGHIGRGSKTITKPDGSLFIEFYNNYYSGSNAYATKINRYNPEFYICDFLNLDYLDSNFGDDLSGAYAGKAQSLDYFNYMNDPLRPNESIGNVNIVMQVYVNPTFGYGNPARVPKIIDSTISNSLTPAQYKGSFEYVDEGLYLYSFSLPVGFNISFFDAVISSFNGMSKIDFSDFFSGFSNLQMQDISVKIGFSTSDINSFLDIKSNQFFANSKIGSMFYVNDFESLDFEALPCCNNVLARGFANTTLDENGNCGNCHRQFNGFYNYTCCGKESGGGIILNRFVCTVCDYRSTSRNDATMHRGVGDCSNCGNTYKASSSCLSCNKKYIYEVRCSSCQWSVSVNAIVPLNNCSSCSNVYKLAIDMSDKCITCKKPWSELQQKSYSIKYIQDYSLISSIDKSFIIDLQSLSVKLVKLYDNGSVGIDKTMKDCNGVIYERHSTQIVYKIESISMTFANATLFSFLDNYSSIFQQFSFGYDSYAFRNLTTSDRLTYYETIFESLDDIGNTIRFNFDSADITLNSCYNSKVYAFSYVNLGFEYVVSPTFTVNNNVYSPINNYPDYLKDCGYKTNYDIYSDKYYLSYPLVNRWGSGRIYYPLFNEGRPDNIVPDTPGQNGDIFGLSYIDGAAPWDMKALTNNVLYWFLNDCPLISHLMKVLDFGYDIFAIFFDKIGLIGQLGVFGAFILGILVLLFLKKSTA